MASKLCKMIRLKELRLANCNMGDKGTILVLEALEEIIDLDVIDLSGNQLGKSPYFNDLTVSLCNFIKDRVELLTSISLCDNNLRGANGEKILKALSEC